MANVFVILDAEEAGSSAPNALGRGTAALRQAIGADYAIEVVAAPTLSERSLPADAVVCPLTLEVPESLVFPGQRLFSICRDVEAVRQRVQQLAYPVGMGEFWLPIVLTGKGALYGEVIAPSEAGSFLQPVHLSDRWRQPLYRLAQRLLTSLTAPPAVYLMQFGFAGGQVCFDRLLPFPALPATASIGVQTPDLYACHWRCLTHQPIVDLAIEGSAKYRVYDPAAEG